MRRQTLLAIGAVALLAVGCNNDNPLVPSTDDQSFIDDGIVTESSEVPTAEITIPELAELENAAMNDLESIRSTGADAAASYYTIDGPTTIDKPGIYRVTKSFSADGDGIVVTASHVVLLLGRHTITGPGAKEGRGVVVESADHVHVVGGKLTSFGIGVVLIESDYSSVRGVRVYGQDEFADPPNGIAPQIGMMTINVNRARIFFNAFYEVNLGLFIRGGDSMRNRIYLNSAVGGDNGLLAICYNPAPDADMDAPDRDRIQLNYLARFGVGVQFAGEAIDNLVRLNAIKYFVSPWEDLSGGNRFVRNRTVQL